MHGFNNDKESFSYMTQGFREQYGDIAEFILAEGPYIIDSDKTPPEEGLVARGFKGPFRSWFEFINCALEEIKLEDEVMTNLAHGNAEEE